VIDSDTIILIDTKSHTEVVFAEQ